MQTLTEQAAALLLAEHSFAPAAPGFVGAAVDLPASGPAGTGQAPPARQRLQHGFLTTGPAGPPTAGARPSPGLVTVSGPPSPGLEACLDRMAEDLSMIQGFEGAQGVEGAQDRRPAGGGATVPAAESGAAAGGIRIGLEAGLDGGGPLGLPRRWALAHRLAPVLAAAFANTPLRDGRPSGWRSVRQSRHRDLARPTSDPRTGWAASVLDAPGPAGESFRARTHRSPRPSLIDLAEHVEALRPPVAARGHLELDFADGQPGAGWRVVVAVTAALLDDATAATAAEAATASLAGESRLWERAARDALADPVLAATARECFLVAYAALSRQGASRGLRDAVAEFTERHVLRGRCPADDVLDRLAQERSPVM